MDKFLDYILTATFVVFGIFIFTPLIYFFGWLIIILWEVMLRGMGVL